MPEYTLVNPQQVFAACVVGSSLAALAVGLRIFCKIRYKHSVRADDYWILAALLGYVGNAVAMLEGVFSLRAEQRLNTNSSRKRRGVGSKAKEVALHKRKLHFSTQSIQLTSVWLIFLMMIFAACAEYACKMSILFYYRRIFGICKAYRRCSLALILLSTAWFLTGLIAGVTMCRPLVPYYVFQSPDECVDWSLMLLSMLIIDAVIDLAILILPIRWVFTLQLPMKMKILLAGIFALGGFVMVTSLIRILYQYHFCDAQGTTTISGPPDIY
jgi:hypothetical protein